MTHQGVLSHVIGHKSWYLPSHS